MYEEKAEPQTSRPTHVEQLRTLVSRIDQQTEREAKILARLRRLEERVDEVLGSEPREAEPELRTYDRR